MGVNKWFLVGLVIVVLLYIGKKTGYVDWGFTED